MVDKMNENLNKKILNKNGQAVFEFILFVPFLVFIYTMFYTVGNAINGSIDQQKATRGYFFAYVSNNSYIYNKSDFDSFSGAGLKKIGLFHMGWSEHVQGKNQFAPCFKFISMLNGTTNEDCDSSTRTEPGSSGFIRTFTNFGICGPYFTALVNPTLYDFDPGLQATQNACSLMSN